MQSRPEEPTAKTRADPLATIAFERDEHGALLVSVDVSGTVAVSVRLVGGSPHVILQALAAVVDQQTAAAEVDLDLAPAPAREPTLRLVVDGPDE